MGDDRAIVYQEGDKWIYRASSVGRSVRCLASARQGYAALPAPEYLMKAAEAGNRYEVVVKGRLRSRGAEIAGEQGSVEVPVGPDAIIRGHLDARHIILPDNGEFPQLKEYAGQDLILEVKSMSGTVFEKWIRHGFEGFPEYAAQISAYMKSQDDRPALYAVVNRDDDQELMLRVLDTPPVPWAEIESKVLLAQFFGREGKLPACDSASQYACPYDYLCDRREILFDEIESGSEQVLIRLSEELDEVRRLEKELRDRKAGLREDVIDALGDRRKVKVGPWSVVLAEVNQKKLDEKKLREKLGQELDEFYTTRSYDTLRVRLVGE